MLKSTNIQKRYRSLILPFLLLFFGIYSVISILRSPIWIMNHQVDHLILLAEQFSKSNLSLSIYNLPTGDIVDYQGRQYLFFGPMASVVLIPFVIAFGREFPQIFLGISSLLICFLATYKIASKNEFSEADSMWLAIFFTFSTVLFGISVVNLSAWQVQAVGTAFLLLAIAEYFTKRRYLIIGSLIALAGMTRVTLYLSGIFFILEAFKEKRWKKNIIVLLFPLICSILLLGIYNYRRFKSVFETGYKYNVSLTVFPLEDNVGEGMFSIKHVPANLYVLFIKSPDVLLKPATSGLILRFPYLKAHAWGFAIFFSSPLIFFLVKSKKESNTFSALFAVIIAMVPSLLYYGIGYSQFGYRYALDFLPILFILLLNSLKPKLSLIAKSLIIIGVVFNCIYLSSLWDMYPHFHIFR